MKKTFAIILIALMAMTAVFATNSTLVDPITVIGTESANLEVSLQINPDEMYFYAFGFTTDSTGSSLNEENRVVPTGYTDTLALTYDPVTSTASDNSMYFYYKARTNAPFYLSFAMTDLTGDMTIGWDATFTETLHIDATDKKDAELNGKAIKSENSKNDDISETSYKASINKSTPATGYFYGLYQISLKTDKIDMVNGTKNVAGTLSVTISAE